MNSGNVAHIELLWKTNDEKLSFGRMECEKIGPVKNERRVIGFYDCSMI
jgi:hypothetical protein